jgi:hypothetical protein
MLHRLAESWSTAHAQILYSTSKAGRKMGLEVRYYYHAIGRGYLSGYLDAAKMLPVDWKLPEIVALQAIGDDDRRSGHGRAKAVLFCRLQMIDGIRPATTIKGIGIGKKRLCPQSPDLFCYGPDKDRICIRVVSPLTEVNLDSCEVAFLYHFIQACSIKKPQDPILLIVRITSRPDAGKINGAFQLLPTSK